MTFRIKGLLIFHRECRMCLQNVAEKLNLLNFNKFLPLDPVDDNYFLIYDLIPTFRIKIQLCFGMKMSI